MRVRWKLAVAAVAAVAATCCVGPRCANKQGGVWGDRHRLLSLRGVVGWKASVICLILQEEQSLARWHRAQLQNGSSEREESRGAGGAARTHTHASVAEVAQVIIRLVRQIKPRPSCLCARRSRALVCDAALRCYNLLPALILRVDPLHATLAIRSFFSAERPWGLHIFNSAVCSACSQCAVADVQTLMALWFSLERLQSAIDTIAINPSHPKVSGLQQASRSHRTLDLTVNCR